MIRALQTLRRRFGFATAALVLLVGLALIFVALYSVARLRASRVSEFVRAVAADPSRLDCSADPPRFGQQLSDGSSIYAYDRRTGASANRQAPPIDTGLLAEVQGGSEYAIKTNVILGYGSVVIAVDRPAPCDVFQLKWRATSELRARTTLTFAMILAVAIAIAVAGGGLWVVRPLLDRLAHASHLASRVGRADAVIEPASTGSRAVHEDELTEVESALRDAHVRILEDREEIESKNRALAEHLADVAHDLKTPLSSLQLELEELSAKLDDAELSAVAARALSDVVYIDSLVGNLRVASEIEEGDADRRAPQRIELGALIERCVARVHPLARRKSIELACARPDEAVHALGDVLHIERALMNLLQNAVTHHDVQEGEGHVAAVLERDGGRWELRIVDDGPGVPPTELPTVAERRKRSRSGDGEGLGLAIVVAVCKRERIELEFSREQPRGLRVTLRGTIDAPAPSLP